jgi:RNA polymerase sigma factor (sigma-70 family)
MRDDEAVASIVAGDPSGLAAAYDKYAEDLHGYCNSLLRQPDDAADAVQDTFLIAASKLAGLRDPERLRAWLFAVARNECLRRMKARPVAASLHEAPEPLDDTVDVSGEAERAEARALIRAAVGGLNNGERDVINQLWHGLEVPEVAAVLGVSRNHAYTLFSRARDQLEASVAVLLVGRAGRRDCATLDGMLSDWDGRLTAALRKRVGRHIDKCQVCSARRRQSVTPALLYNLTPGALLALAASRAGAHGAGHAAGAIATAGHAAGPAAGLRAAVQRLATDQGQHALAYRAGVARHAPAFGSNGFPKPHHLGHLSLMQLPHLPLTMAGGTAVATTATMVVLAIVPKVTVPGGSSGGPQASMPAGSSLPAGTLAGQLARRPGRSPGLPRSPSSTNTGRASALAASSAGGPGSPSTTASPSPSALSGGPSASGGPTASTSPTASASAPPTWGALLPPGQPTPTPTPTPSATVSATTASQPTSGAPASSTPIPATTAPGTLLVSPTTVLLSPLLGGSFTLTAEGGPVSWSIATPTSLLGSVSVSPSSGTLAAGATATVSISVSGLATLDATLTVSPGGQPVTLLLGLG